MEIVHFETYISENGMIKIPEAFSLEGAYADVTIQIKEKKSINDTDISNFLISWTGIISDVKMYDDKYNYILDKY